jgi:hypothetical protein
MIVGILKHIFSLCILWLDRGLFMDTPCFLLSTWVPLYSSYNLLLLIKSFWVHNLIFITWVDYDYNYSLCKIKSEAFCSQLWNALIQHKEKKMICSFYHAILVYVKIISIIYDFIC